MRKLAFALLLSLPAFGQSGLQITLEHPPSVRLGEAITLTAVIENTGAVPAPDVSAWLHISGTERCEENIPLGDLAPGEKKRVSCTRQLLDARMYVVAFAAGTLSGPYEPGGPRYSHSTQASVPRLTDGTDLGLYIATRPGHARPGLPFRFRVVYWNGSFTPAANAALVFTLSEGAFGPKLPAGCVAEGTRAVCSLGTVAAADLASYWVRNQPFTIDVVAPDRSEAPFTIGVELHSDTHEEESADNGDAHAMSTHKTFTVREATDAALRGALAAAGEECHATPCLIAFRIPNGPARWHTIRLESQLDWIRGLRVDVDGTTQTGYLGDTNPDGPEIEIDGAATVGDGLRIPSRCGIAVRGLTLNGFRGSAVVVHDGPYACAEENAPTVVDQNYIGTDPTGSEARPNQRGIVSESAFGVRALGNVVSGNARSAIFIGRGQSLVSGNVIGLNARRDAPLPNGASGVYIGPDGDGTDVDDNHIGYNAHFGVGIDRGAEFVALRGNSFQANRGLSIDWGLDGPELGGPAAAPRIRGVRYAAGVTTMEADARPTSSSPFVSFYASDAPDPSGYGEGRYFLGSARWPFRLEVPLDLRGKWISATLTEVQALFIYVNDISRDYRTTTSEMSRAVEVRE